MKTATILSMLASAGLWLSSANAAPVDSSTASNLVVRDCKVNARELYSWVESGWERYRVAYSGPATYIDGLGRVIPFDADAGRGWWAAANEVCDGMQINVGSYYNDVEKTLVIDNSEAQGPAGKAAMGCQEARFIHYMMRDTGCGTG